MARYWIMIIWCFYNTTITPGWRHDYDVPDWEKWPIGSEIGVESPLSQFNPSLIAMNPSCIFLIALIGEHDRDGLGVRLFFFGGLAIQRRLGKSLLYRSPIDVISPQSKLCLSCVGSVTVVSKSYRFYIAVKLGPVQLRYNCVSSTIQLRYVG